MQRARSSLRASTQHSTLSSMSSAKNSQKGIKRKESEPKKEQQPDVVATINTNKKNKEIAVEDEAVLNAEVPVNDGAPWENFEPFSANRMSWMLQQLFSGIRENRGIMYQVQEDIELFYTSYQQNIQHLQLLAEKGKTVNDVKPTTSHSEKSLILPHSEKPFSYPLGTIESLYKLEAELTAKSGFQIRLISLLMGLPNPDEHEFLLNILNFLLKVELMVEFSYYGKAPCQCFKSLLLCEVIKKTVRKKFPNAGEHFFAERIAAWIKRCKKQANKMKQ